MKYIIPIFLIATLFVSCSEKEGKPEVIIAGTTALIIGDPMDCGLDSMTIFPVGCTYIPEVIEGAAPSPRNEEVIDLRENKVSFSINKATSTSINDRNAAQEYYNSNLDDYDIRNLLFYNMTSGQSYPLVEDSVHILSFALHKEFSTKMIFYRVVKEDYNQDKKYDSKDPVMLYTSNLDGSNFQQITPPNEYFIDYTVYEKTNSILIKSAIDSDKNFKFMKNDETNFRSMKLDNPKFAESIFSEEMKDRIRSFN